MLTAKQDSTPIPDKLFFKIGEVCELVGVQAHVLRYWESGFPMLQPQKNRAGQRTYRRKDVEMALRIKALLYDEGFTIAGAKKKLQTEGRGAGRLKVVPPGATSADFAPSTPVENSPVAVVESAVEEIKETVKGDSAQMSRETIKRLRTMLEELLTTLDRDVID